MSILCADLFTFYIPKASAMSVYHIIYNIYIYSQCCQLTKRNHVLNSDLKKLLPSAIYLLFDLVTAPITGISLGILTNTSLISYIYSQWPNLLEFESRTSSISKTGRGGRISRMEASHEEGREFESQSPPTNDLSNWFLSLPSLALGINRTGQDKGWLAQYRDNV